MDRFHLEAIYNGRVNHEPSLYEKWSTEEQRAKYTKAFNKSNNLEEFLAQFKYYEDPKPKPVPVYGPTEYSDNIAVRSKQLHMGHQMLVSKGFNMTDYLVNGGKKYIPYLIYGDFVANRKVNPKKYNTPDAFQKVANQIMDLPKSKVSSKEKKEFVKTIFSK